MIVPDTNLLLYAYLPGVREHALALAWWQDLMNGHEDIGLVSPVVFGFLRLLTNRRLFDSASTVEEALTIVEQWFGRPNVRLLHPGPRHLELAFRLLRAAGSGGNLTTDAQIAALAIEHQGEVHSNDQDFGLLPGVRWKNPLVAVKVRKAR